MIIAACLNYLGINKIWRILRFGVILLAMIVILRSQSRGQMIAAVIAIALGIMLSHGIHRLKKVLVAVGSISITVKRPIDGPLYWFSVTLSLAVFELAS